MHLRYKNQFQVIHINQQNTPWVDMNTELGGQSKATWQISHWTQNIQMSYQCSSEQNYWLINMKFRYVSICTGSGWIQCMLYCSVYRAMLNRLTTSDVVKGLNGWIMYHDSYPLIVATPYSLHGVIGWWFVSWRCIRINVSHMYAPLVISYILYPCNYPGFQSHKYSQVPL